MTKQSNQTNHTRNNTKKHKKTVERKSVKKQRVLDELDPAVVDFWFDYEKENLLRIRDRKIYNLNDEAFFRQENNKLNALLILDPFTNDTCDHALALIKDLVTSQQHVELNSEENQYIFNVLHHFSKICILASSMCHMINV